MVSLVKAMQSGDVPATPALVLSNDPAAGGLKKAQALGVPTLVVDHRSFPKDRVAFENTLHQHLRDAEIDVICLAGFMRVLTAAFVDRWAGRMLNIHPSLLPKYKGLNTHQRALDAGDSAAGCTVHLVTPDLDDGPILEQAHVPVLADDTAATLAARVLVEEHRIYPAALRAFLNTQTAV